MFNGGCLSAPKAPIADTRKEEEPLLWTIMVGDLPNIDQLHGRIDIFNSVATSISSTHSWSCAAWYFAV